METKLSVPKIEWKSKLPLGLIVAVVVVMAVVAVGVITLGGGESGPTITSTASLKEIIDVEELATYQIDYGGVAECRNADKPEKVDYYVYYTAVVKLGIDLEQASIDVDHRDKVIEITLPEVQLTSSNVDTEDFIFYNKKADNAGTIQQARLLCEQDVTDECSNNETIRELARENAKSTITALVEPLLKGTGYTLDVA